jgi:acyl-coenzyme A synthetase/AMP-(fatty) acid ligase
LSAVIQTIDATARLPLVAGPADRVIAWRDGVPVDAAQFLAHVAAVAAQLPAGPSAVNLCDDRYRFLVAFCAIVSRGQVNLLPPSRAPQAVLEVMHAHPGCYAVSDQTHELEPPNLWRMPDPGAVEVAGFDVPHVPAGRVVAVGYTSGSTGAPKANPKTWGSFSASTQRNAALLRERVGAAINVVATVPPQHMYGMETSVLLPLVADVAIDAGKPLLPADVARTLAAVPAPRLLVATPVHLRALAQAGVALPPVAAVLSATAPLSAELAAEVESRFATTVIEVFGSTETCVIAHRRTAVDDCWLRYDGVELKPQPDGTQVDAPWFVAPVLLQDIVELLPGNRFRLCGRNADLLEIAGKRASLGDLTRRLLAIPGVEDGAVFQSDDDAAGVQRIAALVVAPTLSEGEILARLRESIDPAFLPRPIRRVASLPRNETGKLPRAALIAALRGS